MSRCRSRSTPLLIRGWILLAVGSLLLAACSQPAPQVDAERAFDDLLALVNIGEHRRSGTPNEIKTVEYLESQLRDAGIEPVRDSFPAEIFVYEEPWIEAGEGEAAWRPKCFPLYYTGSTGPEPLTAPAVLIGAATAGEVERFDLEGKIAVVELIGLAYQNLPIPTMPDDLRGGYEDQVMPLPVGLSQVYDRVADSGAVGMIAVVTFGFRNAHYGMNTFEFEGRMRMPALMVSAEDGARLVDELLENPDVSVAFQLDAHLEQCQIHNLSVEIPGQTRDVVVLNSAHTAWFKGAVERAGSVGVVEIARYVSRLPLEKRINTFVASLTTGHEIGWLGVRRFMETKTEYVERMAAFVNMGSSIAPNGWVKKEGEWRPTGEVHPRFGFVSPHTRMWSIAERAIADSGMVWTVIIDASQVDADSQDRFAQALGIPTASIICSPPYYHSSEDLPEHLNVDAYDRALRAYAQIVSGLLMEDRETLRQLPGE
jgi:hypothetical protein